MSKKSKQPLDPAKFLKGIDPLFWNLSEVACFALIKQVQLNDLLLLEPLNLLSVEEDCKHDSDDFKMLATKQIVLRDTKRLRDAVATEKLVNALTAAKSALPEFAYREPLVLTAANQKGFGKSKK